MLEVKFFNMSKFVLKSNCDDEGGKFIFIVNFNSCGVKEDCVVVCFFDLFEMWFIIIEDRVMFNLKGKIKIFFDKRKVYLMDLSRCYVCGVCV